MYIVYRYKLYLYIYIYSSILKYISRNIKWVSQYKYFNFKTIFYKVNYNFNGKLPYFPATCLKYNNFVGYPITT